LVGAAVALAGGVLSMHDDPVRVVILSGDTQGYLSPCGCSSPMVGGIRRKATVIRNLSRGHATTLLENGGMVESSGRQDQMKAETIAQSMANLGVSAINVGAADAHLGAGMLLQLAQLSNDRLVSGSVSNPGDHGLKSSITSGPFLIGGVTESPVAVANALGDAAVPIEVATKGLVDEAETASLKPLLMLQGTHDTAARLAKEFPSLALIQYTSVGDPPSKVERIGTTVLATTGEHGKHVVALTFKGGKFTDYSSITLGPEYRDDPTIGRFYSTYLSRVKGEKLLEKLPRHETAAYAGSWACTPCHNSATHVWKGSGHRLALDTLVKVQHDFDPDCVSCHVVGLDSTRGYRSRSKTPQLAGVGCESCHGPAAAHAQAPQTAKLLKIGERACVGCHNSLNSPNFEFRSYWRKIIHG
jgi:predicted CXXCH cytochrome family protein